MNEHEFLQKLQQRAKEQEKIINDMVFPGIFTTVSIWLGNHPWRILIPLAFIFSLIFHAVIGKPYDNLILRIFGGPN
jgi:hypothetical protein